MIDPNTTRKECPNGIDCEHCGYMPMDMIVYEDGDGTEWCPACAYAEGLIDDEQFEKDEYGT